jgi:sugar lactone lactonase YvrE
MFKTARTLGLAMTLAMVSIHPPSWAVAGEINLYVANEDNGTVRQFSESGTDLGNFAMGLNAPAWISVDRSGDLFVSNFTGNSVQEYSPQGNFLMTISTPFQPGDALVTASGTILVADYFGGKIYQYSSTGQSLGLFCNPGLGRADFMAFDSQGNVYVTDFGFHTIGVVEKISPTGVDEGKFLNNVGGIGGIAFDSHGNLYAAFGGPFSYNGTDMIREYSASGQDLGLITSTGLDNPIGITFGPDGNLYVANYGNDTIHEFSPTGTDLGVFASTGLDGPRSLVFDAASVPEPSSAVLLIMGGVTIPTCFLLRRHSASGQKARGSL